MAKGKKIKNNIDNDFDFDSNLDFDDLDFSADPFKDDRKPATKIKDGLKSGIKGKASDPAFISGVLKELLPKGFGDTLDLGDKVSTNVRQLYMDAANEVKPAINDFKRVAAKLAPKDSKYIPDPVKKILKKWEEESKAGSLSAGLDARAQRESMISMQLGQIFEQQFAQTEKDKRESDSKDLIKEGIELNRHRDLFTVLNQSSVSLSRISQYQTTINLQYQKKSLELQHRQLFAQYDILETITKTHALQTDAFSKIVKNTALPEWQKINLAELSKQKFFNKFTDSLGTAVRGFMPSADEYLQMTTRRIRDKTLGAIKANVQGFRSGLTEAEMAKEQMSGGMADMIDKYEVAGDTVGEWGTDTLGHWAGKKLRDPLIKAFPNIDKAGDYLENFNENIVGTLEKFRKNPKWQGARGPKAWFIRTVQDLLPGLGVDKSFNRISGKDLEVGQPFTVRTERSINEVIPGYLSRILQEMQIMRTGNRSIDRIEYDQDKGRFTSSRKILKDIATGLYTDKNAKRSNEILDKIISNIVADEENKLTDEDKDKIKEAILRNKLSYKDLNTGISGRPGKVMRSYLSKIEGSDKDKLILNRRLNSLVSDMSDPRARIEQLISEGRQNELTELGIITRTDQGYELNMDTFIKGQLGKGRYDALNRRHSSVVSNAFGSSMKSASTHAGFSGFASNDYTDNFNQITSRLDTSIGHYEEIIALIKALMATGFKQGAKNDSLDNETDTLFTKGKFHYNRAKQFLKKNKQKLDDRIENSGIKDKTAKHFGKFTDFINRQKPKLSSGLSNAGGRTKKAAETIKQKLDKLSNTLKDNWKELYIKGESDPRLTQAKMMAGQYYDTVTGKIINKLTDIKGSVKDITTDTVVLKAEEIKDLLAEKTTAAKETAADWYDRTKQKMQGSKMGQKFTDFIKDAKSRWTELYVQGENNPRIIKAKLLAGHYYDAISGKTIKVLEDIRGAVKDRLTGETVLNADEVEKSYVKQEDGTLRKFIGFVKRTFEPIYSAFKSTNIGSFVAGGLEKLWGAVKDNAAMMKSVVYGAKDVWVEGEKYPRLTAVKMQQGHYTDAVSGKTIYSPSDIAGEVKDEKGDTKIAADELDRLMVYEGRSRRFAPIRKFLRGVGAVAGGIAWYYKKIGIPLTKFNFRMIAKASSVALKSAQWMFGTGPYTVKDVYVGGEPEPRLYATKMKNGEYFNKSDGKPIYHQNDINGEVTDANGTTLIFDEDLPNLKVYNSIMGLFNPFKPIKWISQKIGKAASWTMKQGLKATKFLTRNIAKVTMGIAAGFVRYLSKPEDVYVKGEPTPRLRAILMKAGRYVSEKTGKTISLVEDIDGPIWDQEEQIRVLDNGDINKGLVKENGEPFKTTLLQDAIAGIKKINKFFSYRGKLNIGKPLEPNKNIKDKETTGEQTVSLLGDIKNIFQDYFTKKKVKGDTDGDGDREGSWQDIMQKREAEKAKRQTNKPGEAKPKEGEKKGGLMSILASALDAITGFLGGFKSLFKAGGVLGGLGKLLGLGRAAGAVATAAGGMGTLGTIGAGLAAVVSSPVTLGVVGAAIAGYGAYKGYKALRRWMSKPSTLDNIRYTQYGFKKDNTSFFNKIVDLEEYMKQFVKVGSEQATIDEKKMDIDEMMSIFGFSSKDEKHKNIYGTWYIKRFKPVYLTHVSALNIINGSIDLTKINDLKKEEKLKYIEATKFSSGPYTVTTLPVLDGSVTASNAADVAAAVEAALKEFATQPGGSKSTGTALPTDSKKPEDIKSGGRLDYSSNDVVKKLPGASVSGSSGIGASASANAVSAFDTVRYKTYGLKELEKGKVVSLIMLEAQMAKKITYQGTKASFDGNPNELLEKVTTYFGIPDLFSDAAVAWTKWFRDRFLPVYLNFATLHMQAVNKPPKADSAPVLDANQQYDIALAVSSTGGAWRVKDAPWEGYELNTNPDTVKANLEFLKEAVKQKTLREEQAQENAKKQDPNAAPVKSPAVTAFQSKTPEYNPPTSGSISQTSTAPKWDRAGPSMSGGMGTGPTTEGIGGTKPDPSAKVPDPTGPGINGLKDTIVNAAKVVGIDPNIMLTTAAIESDFNPNAKAPTSSASGLMQFINSTWKETVNKHGGKYGYDQSTSPFDAKASALMGAHYIKDSLSNLAKSYKGAISSVEAYLVHFMGPGGAAKFLRAMQENPGQYGSQLMPKEAAANQSIFFGSGGPRTLGEIYQWFYNKVRTKAARYGISLPASSGADTSEKSKYVMPGAGQNTGVVSEVNKPNGSAPMDSGAPAASKPAATASAPSAVSSGEPPKSAYNPTARPAAKQQQAMQASRQAATPLTDAVGFNPKVMGTSTETANASKNTLTADIMKNTESILSQSLDVQKETLDVMKMIYEKINNIKAPEVAPKSEAKQYEAPKAPVPMRKSA